MKLSFSEFSIDRETAEVLINGTIYAIDERNIMLIQLLANSYPEYCSKQDCLDKIWVGTVVSDMSLSKLVSDTRKIFSKAGYSEPLIQTVHGRGYRLEHVLGKQLSLQTQPSTADGLAASSQAAQKTPFTSAPFIERRKKIAPISWWEIFAKVLIALLLVLALIFQFWLGGANSDSVTTQTKNLNYSEPTKALGRVLWVDDHPENNLAEKAYLEEKNIGVYNTVTSEEALMLLSMYHYQAVISDMGRHGDSLAGLKLLQAIRAAGYDTDFYLYTYVESPGVIDAIAQSGGQAVVIDSDALYELILAHF
ncbi:CadC family transcriptional regulator [Shewanella sp. Choline-02u-19]|uniref:winged helix-turn-helix domain-containing protein n=1 Tax=unclassified Shewanella TaxID=196818 RepID=UPI000C340635|nr:MULTISPECIES: winged helix-turn-helix domain-containing protein [unclassified Shewanella]PKH55550.1 CadC family transcriptional regulator [Shewanella sp. Bg11-22]PKI29976.1 CadC family transcriptional regulator [Shewanella sp. Choline-02u-19]